MMPLSNNFAMLHLHTDHSDFYPCLYWDQSEVILFDTGLPQTREELLEQLEKLGFSAEMVTQVVLTHHDLDHVGNATFFASRGAEIYTSPVEAAYLRGEKPPEKQLLLEATDNRSPVEEGIYQLILKHSEAFKIPQVQELVIGEPLPFLKDMIVIDTAGHTPGHVSFWLPTSKLLLAGDAAACTSEGLALPEPRFCSDPELAEVSFNKLVNLPYEQVICYHGGCLEK